MRQQTLTENGLKRMTLTARMLGDFRDIFVAGENGFGSYRIPALLSLQSGRLVAFCEAREVLSDHARNKIVARMSDDGGHSWGPLQLVAEADDDDALNNPLVVQNRTDGNVVLMYQRYPRSEDTQVDDVSAWVSHPGQTFSPNFHEGAVAEGYNGHVCRSFIKSSSDNCVSWSKPIEITRQVKRPQRVTSYAGGPGHGIQLARGRWPDRLVMPFCQGPWGEMKVYAVISDDGGEHWHYGELAADDGMAQANEVQIAELGNGDLYLNCRSSDGSFRRKSSISTDGGESWSELETCTDLLDPQCQGSVLAWPNGDPATMIYCGALHASLRQNGGLMQSNDQGRHWHPLTSFGGAFHGYSDMAQVDENTLAVLVERDNYKRISFCSMALETVAEL